MRIRLPITLLIFFLLLSSGRPALAADEFIIAAIVNDHVISVKDVEERMEVTISSSGLKDSAEIREKLQPQIVQMLIDEELQKQESEKLGLAITSSEMERAIAELEKQNNLAPGSFTKFVASKGLKQNAVEEQLRAHVLWTKILYRKIKPKIVISDFEIEEVKERIEQQKHGTEVFLSEIILPVATPSQEAEVKELAENLSKELKAGGDFASIAKQFSISRTARNKGLVGWLPENDLGMEIKEAIKDLKPAQISSAIRTSGGYVVLKLHERREIKSDKNLPDENKIRELLINQKLDLEARRFKTDLRRNAFIEKRI